MPACKLHSWRSGGSFFLIASIQVLAMLICLAAKAGVVLGWEKLSFLAPFCTSVRLRARLMQVQVHTALRVLDDNDNHHVTHPGKTGTVEMWNGKGMTPVFTHAV